MPYARAVSLAYLGKDLTFFSNYARKACKGSPGCNAPEFLVNHNLALLRGFEGSLPIHEFLKSCKSSYGVIKCQIGWTGNSPGTSVDSGDEGRCQHVLLS